MTTEDCSLGARWDEGRGFGVLEAVACMFMAPKIGINMVPRTHSTGVYLVLAHLLCNVSCHGIILAQVPSAHTGLKSPSGYKSTHQHERLHQRLQQVARMLCCHRHQLAGLWRGYGMKWDGQGVGCVTSMRVNYVTVVTSGKENRREALRPIFCASFSVHPWFHHQTLVSGTMTCRGAASWCSP